jgi:hypothetical protein
MKMNSLLFSTMLGLAGCSDIPIGTALRLAALDPLSADPAGMAVALDLPDGVGIVPGSAELALRAQAADGAEISGRYGLETTGDGVWHVRDGDRARLRADQARVAAWERADPAGTVGQFSVTLAPCLTSAGDIGRERLSAALQLEPGGPFLPLLRDVPVAELTEGVGLPDLPRCEVSGD